MEINPSASFPFATAISGEQAVLDDLISEWDRDKTELKGKALIAATRAEVRAINLMARDRLIERGFVRAAESITVQILDRAGNAEPRDFAPGDRIVLTQNDKPLGATNGATGRLHAIETGSAGEPLLAIELDSPNAQGATDLMIPAAFARFDHAYCLTNHKSQGRTFDSAHVLINPALVDREWAYVAASRSRFATTLYADSAALRPMDPDAHQAAEPVDERDDLISALASRVRRSRAKGTTLDWERLDPVEPDSAPPRNFLMAWAQRRLAARADREIEQAQERAR